MILPLISRLFKSRVCNSEQATTRTDIEKKTDDMSRLREAIERNRARIGVSR